MALDAVRGGGREVFGPFLPKPRLPPLSSPVRFKYYLNPPCRFSAAQWFPPFEIFIDLFELSRPRVPRRQRNPHFARRDRIRAPILSNRSRIVVHCARAIFVPANPSRRSASTTQYPIDEKYKRI